jgi:hypothetical protein
VRFEAGVLERLNRFVRVHPGLSLSSATNLLVDEALRSQSHPLIGFVDGPTGRRARLAGGPDVDVVIRALTAARDAQPDRSVDEILTLVGQTSGLSGEIIGAAIEYWAEFAEEIDGRIEQEQLTEDQARVHARRADALLASSWPPADP